MKKVIVKYPHSETTTEGILLESLSDLQDYTNFLQKKPLAMARKILKLSEPIERVDHCFDSFEAKEKAILQLSIHRSNVSGKNLIYCLDSATSSLIQSLAKHLAKGAVFLNQSGGFCPMRLLEMVSISGVVNSDELKPPNVNIKQGSKFLILENDPQLEAKAIKICSKNLDDSFSYIVNLRELSSLQLRRTFQQFITQGGEGLYVYTTGSDIEQLYEYVSIACQTGMKKIVFTFTAGTHRRLETAMCWAKKQNIQIKIIKE